MDLKTYTAVFTDETGQGLGQANMLASGYQAALRKLSDVPAEAKRIEVFAEDGSKAGEVSTSYWRQRLQR